MEYMEVGVEGSPRFRIRNGWTERVRNWHKENDEKNTRTYVHMYIGSSNLLQSHEDSSDEGTRENRGWLVSAEDRFINLI